MAQMTRLASFGPFSLFVGLRRPSLAAGAFVGFCGCRPRQRGVWGVWGSRLVVKKIKCTVKKTRPSPSFGLFSIFVGLRRPSLAAVGLRGLSWISVAPGEARFR